MAEAIAVAKPLCPSARPEMEDAVIFGIATGDPGNPVIGYLSTPLPVTPERLAMSAPATPAEVFRIAAPCATHACRHFDGQRCQLAARTVQQLRVVVPVLPACRIRATCRWWLQEGREACLRCPQVVTDSWAPAETMIRAAMPTEIDDGSVSP